MLNTISPQSTAHVRPFAHDASGVLGAVRFPYIYLALILVSALDLLLTHTVISIGGREVNPVANAVLNTPADFNGLIVYKFAIVFVVMMICEYIVRHAADTGRRLALGAVGISAFPVVWSVLLLWDVFSPHL